MPVFYSANVSLDPDRIPRKAFAVGLDMVVESSHQPAHQHRKAQLIFTMSGLVTCSVANGIWALPPQCAMWIPGGMSHSAQISGRRLRMCCLYLEREIADFISDRCCTLAVSPLLRELLLRSMTLPEDYRDEGPEQRLIEVLLDEISAAPIGHLHLPMPSDQWLNRLLELMMTSPSHRKTIAEWGSVIGASERTLSRLAIRDLGMTFGEWRQQFDVVMALQRLSQGDSVQTVASDLGYETVSGFIAMFKKVLGQPPTRYLATSRAVNSTERK